MNVFRLIQNKSSQLRSLNRATKLYLISVVMYGIVTNGWQLFFNFYILERGFSREFLGTVNSAPYLAVMVLGIPMGILADRLGYKQAMFLGILGSSLCRVIQVTTTQPMLVVTAAFLTGVANALFLFSQAPFLMRVSNPGNRTLLFSINFGLGSLSGVIGNTLAGYLPAVFRGWFGGTAQSAIVYQAVLLTLVGLSIFALPPILLIPELPAAAQNRGQRRLNISFWQVLRKPLVLKLSLPNLFIGFGAAIVNPYMNLFFAERFTVGDQFLGLLFSGGSILMVIGSLILPYLARRLGGKIHAVIVMQAISVGFLLMLCFSPYLWLAALSFLLRGALMNMTSPLYDSFVMEQAQEGEQATVNSVKEMANQLGWAIGPYISGVVQSAYGFTPLFIAMSILYALAISSTRLFFGRKKLTNA